MLHYLTWAGVSLALLATGWAASAWLHQRKINFLQLQIKVMRQTAVAHTDQARRQIGQLQTELASRPPALHTEPAPETSVVNNIRRRAAAPDRFVVLEDGFAQTAVIGEAFAPTQMMR